MLDKLELTFFKHPIKSTKTPLKQTQEKMLVKFEKKVKQTASQIAYHLCKA